MRRPRSYADSVGVPIDAASAEWAAVELVDGQIGAAILASFRGSASPNTSPGHTYSVTTLTLSRLYANAAGFTGAQASVAGPAWFGAILCLTRSTSFRGKTIWSWSRGKWYRPTPYCFIRASKAWGVTLKYSTASAGVVKGSGPSASGGTVGSRPLTFNLLKTATFLVRIQFSQPPCLGGQQERESGQLLANSRSLLRKRLAKLHLDVKYA